MAKLAINGGKPLRTKPFLTWPIIGKEEIAAALGVLNEGRLGRIARFGMGGANFTDKFREAWKTYYPGKEYAIPCVSCCAALELSLRNAGIGPGDEVITTPSTWVSPNLAPLHVGASVAFADVSPDNYCINPAAIEAAITKKTRAIIVVHIGGYCCAMDKITALARKKNLIVIEDCAQAQGSKYKGKYVGTWGDFGCYSFDIAKLMTAGEGGMLVCDDKALGNRVYGVCGHAGAQIDKIISKRRIDGWNYRMTETQAAILLAQLPRVERQKRTRIKNADHLRKRLSEVEGIGQVPFSPEQNYYSFIFKYDKTCFKNVPKKKFREALIKEGINKLFASPSDQEPAYRSPYFSGKVDLSKVHCPVAERAYTEEAMGISGAEVLLGAKKDMDDIADAVIKIKENIDELV